MQGGSQGSNIPPLTFFGGAPAAPPALYTREINFIAMPGKRPCCGTPEKFDFRVVPEDADVLRHLNDQLVPRNGTYSFKCGDYICKSHFKDPFSCARFKSSKEVTLFERWFRSDDGLDVDSMRLHPTENVDRLARRYSRSAGDIDDDDGLSK